MGEHLAHGVTVQTEHAGSLPDAHAVYHACSSDAQIQFHSVHPSHLPWGRVVLYGRWRRVQFSTAVDRRSSRPSGILLLRRLQSSGLRRSCFSEGAHSQLRSTMFGPPTLLCALAQCDTLLWRIVLLHTATEGAV